MNLAAVPRQLSGVETRNPYQTHRTDQPYALAFFNFSLISYGVGG